MIFLLFKVVLLSLFPLVLILFYSDCVPVCKSAEANSRRPVHARVCDHTNEIANLTLLQLQNHTDGDCINGSGSY